MKRCLSGGRIWIRAIVLGIILCSLLACGTNVIGHNVQGDSQYVPEFIIMDGEEWLGKDVQMVGPKLYYFAKNAEGRTEICTYSLENSERSVTILNWQAEREERNIESFAVGEDGGFYVLARNGRGTQDWYELCRFDIFGEVMFSLNVTEQVEEHYTVIAVDAKGHLYLGSGEKIWLYDDTGSCQGSISLGSSGEGVSSILCGGDGKVYAVYDKNSDALSGVAAYYLSELDFDSQSMKASYGGFGEGLRGLISGSERNFLGSDDKTIYECSMDGQVKRPLMDWMDCGIDGSWAKLAGVLEDGRIVAVYEDAWDGTGGIVVLTETNEQTEAKETIVFGVMSMDGEQQAEIAKFNRENSGYRIVVKEYYTDGKSWEDAAADLVRDIGVGDCPDVVKLSGLSVGQLADKGAFEDLMPYLENSSVLNREDVVESILQAYTFGDVLVSVPSHITVRTVVGSASLLDSGQKWTMDEIIAFADTHPGVELFDRANKDSLMRFLMTFYVDAFLDWRSKECSFNSDEFRHLLEFVKRFPDKTERGKDAVPTPSRIQKGEVLLMEDFLAGFEATQVYQEMFQENMAYVGYPTMDGSGGHIIFSATHDYAIPDRALHKDGAWDFIENMLSQAFETEKLGRFPTSKSRLDEMAQDTVYGEQELDETGMPVFGTITYGSGNGNQWVYTYHAVTQDEVDQVLDVINRVKLPVVYSEDIMNIISEETESYYKGQKTLDEVAAIIQSRVSIYMGNMFSW